MLLSLTTKPLVTLLTPASGPRMRLFCPDLSARALSSPGTVGESAVAEGEADALGEGDGAAVSSVSFV